MVKGYGKLYSIFTNWLTSQPISSHFLIVNASLFVSQLVMELKNCPKGGSQKELHETSVTTIHTPLVQDKTFAVNKGKRCVAFLNHLNMHINFLFLECMIGILKKSYQFQDKSQQETGELTSTQSKAFKDFQIR